MDLVMTAAEEAAELASFRAQPASTSIYKDLTDGGQVERANIFPTKGGVRQARGRAAARRAWRWDGAETLLPLAWNPEGTTHDGARHYLRKKVCICCHEAGFMRECQRCVRANCVGCGGGTDKAKVIPCYYLSKEKVPFPQRFYGDIDCFLPMCARKGGMGFKAEEDMRMHARTMHGQEYASFMEAEQSRKASDTDDLRQQVAELRSLLFRQGLPVGAMGVQPPPPPAPVSAVGSPEAPLYVKEPKPAKV